MAAYETTDEVEWLVQVGRYVQHCWLAEESARQGDDFDELGLLHLWDRCDEKTMRDLRAEASKALQDYRVQVQWSAITARVRRAVKSRRLLTWHLKELYGGFLGGVGILLFGLLVAALAPGLIKMVRSAVDDLLPVHTQPDLRNEQPPQDAAENRGTARQTQ